MDLGDVMQAGAMIACNRMLNQRTALQPIICTTAGFVGHVVGDATLAILSKKGVDYFSKTVEDVSVNISEQGGKKAEVPDLPNEKHGLSDLIVYEIPGSFIGKELSEAPCSVFGGAYGKVAAFACEMTASYIGGSTMKEALDLYLRISHPPIDP